MRRQNYGYLPSRPWAGTKLHCLPTETHVCEQIASACHLNEERPKIESRNFESLNLNHHTTRRFVTVTVIALWSVGRGSIFWNPAHQRQLVIKKLYRVGQKSKLLILSEYVNKT